jgi:uncharacterized protein
MGLLIRSSDIHAAGCYTTEVIPTGTRIVEYTGPRVTPEQGDERYENRETTYLFGLEGGMLVDGEGMAAFINHSCDPNCETDEIDGRVWIFAARDITAGEELTYDYNLYDGEEDDPAPCTCGTKKCRGTMYSPEEVIRRKKKKAGKTRARKPPRAAQRAA